MGHAVDGDLPLLHRLQQRGLGLRCGAVDLVGEDELRDDGTGRNSKRLRLLVEDVDPVTSLGRRSGVNWMRLKVQPIVRATALARTVLPTPGTSSIRT